MTGDASIAIETSCRVGGVALGLGDRLIEAIDFDASSRHATQLICRLDDLLAAAALRATDLAELYVSAGPGSFTGLRVGITVARTLTQAVPHLRCVAVPTPVAVAENARPLPWEHLGVLMDAKDRQVYAARFARRSGTIAQVGRSTVATPETLLARWPRPLLLVGEAVRHCRIAAEGVESPDPSDPVHWPSARSVWRAGRALAAAGQFVEHARLLPIYARKPEAVRLWERRHGRGP